MELSFYRPPYHDELMYGWLKALAEANFPNDILAVKKIINIVFPYSKLKEGVDNNYGRTPRMDYLNTVFQYSLVYLLNKKMLISGYIHIKTIYP